MGEGPEPPYYWVKTWEAEADDFLRQASELEATLRDAPDDMDAHHEAQELIWRALLSSRRTVSIVGMRVNATVVP